MASERYEEADELPVMIRRVETRASRQNLSKYSKKGNKSEPTRMTVGAWQIYNQELDD